MLPTKFRILLALWILTVVSGRIKSVEAVNRCWTCVDDCEDAVVQSCANTSDDCYIQFTAGNNDVVRKGCSSELGDEAALAALIKKKELWLCATETCNNYANLPKTYECKSCDSEHDERCATQPDMITDIVKCNILPYTECVEYVTNVTQGRTVRGCLNALEDELFYGCFTHMDANCRTCTGLGCNNQVIPTGRRQCQRCNSASDPGCLDAPNALAICPEYDETDGCVTRIEKNGVDVTRGCQSEVSCVGYTSGSCRVCHGDGCNTINLVAESIGDPGDFQGLPLNCYHCDGATECLASLGKANVCYGDKYQVCSTAISKSTGQVVQRGCSDSLAVMCSSPVNNCYECKSNGCNTLTKESELVDCLFCDGRNSDECALQPASVTRTRKCQKTCMTVSLVRNATDPRPVHETLRTCLDDLDMDDREKCEAGSSPNCKSCATAKCNTALLHTPRRSCYHCSGKSCASPAAMQCSAWTEADQCYVEFDAEGGVLGMGCSSEYESYELRASIAAKRLWQCDGGDNCNALANVPTEQSCVLCNSRSDADCAIAPEKVKTTTKCSQLPYTGCYTRLLADRHTERGCEASLESEDFYGCLTGMNSTKCNTCVGNNCNKEPHPDDRQTCHVCNSRTDPACATATPNAAQKCLLYAPGDACVSHIDGNGFTVRDCASSLTCDERDPARCNICAGAACNTVNLQRTSDAKPGMWQDLPLTCWDCANQADCTANRTTETKCSGEEYCVTVFTANGAAVQRRGCSKVVEQESGAYCDANAARCYNCNSNRCNTANSLTQYGSCLNCDARTNADCTFAPEAVLGRRQCDGMCMTAMHERSNGSSVYVVVRGCANDKDAADQQACLDSNGHHCKLCTGADCNQDVIPPHRRSCLQCSGDECEEPTAGQCHNWQANDQCYILFNRRNNVAQMGCVSDLEEEFVEANWHMLLTCGEDDCNTFSIIPTPKTCIKCHSREDVRCATSPLDVPTVEECSSLPHVECRMAVNNDGTTERGCVSSLLRPGMMNCLDGNSSTCATCLGDRCNVDIYPADRRSCHRCDTKSDPSCQSAPDAATICPIYRADERCSSKFVSGNTYRGCGFDFTCDEADPQYCRMCNTSDCNVADLSAAHIGYPGHWQAVPINCYTCSGAGCVGVVRKCEGNKLQNCGTVFASNGTVVERGCTDSIYATSGEYCDANSSHCKFCKSSGCNTAKALTEYDDCIFCDSAEDANCALSVTAVTRRRSCRNKCMVGRYARTSEVNPAYELERSCLDDLDMDEREECEKGTLANCVACSGQACNTAALPAATHLRCNYCANSNCTEVVSRECRAYRPHDQCFTQFYEGSVVQRLGCFSDEENSYAEANKKRLLLCDGDNCNTLEFEATPTACVVCNSAKDAKCVTHPEVLAQAGCDDLPYTSCYMDIDEAGVLHRGCLSDVSNALLDDCLSGNSTRCTVCDTHGCNTVPYPAERHSCLRCNSDTDADCEAGAAKYAELCPLYLEDDRCVTTLTGGRTLRGCLSDFTCDANKRETCRICDGAENCNSVNLAAAAIGSPGQWQQLPLNCYVCNSTADCANGHRTVHKCEDNNLQTCMTVFNSAGAVMQRGCSDTVLATHADYCDEAANNCIGCKSSGCNEADARSMYRECYFCDSSETGSSCSVALDTAKASTRLCHGGCAVMTHARSATNTATLELTRSCLDDMDLDDRVLCSNGQLDYCTSCNAVKCNTAVLPANTVRLSCYACIGAGCETPTRRQCSAYHPADQCYTVFDPFGSLIGLGCRSEYEDNVVAALQRQKQMLLCDGADCNNPSNIPQPQMCSVCDSRTDARCATNPNLVGQYERCSTLPYTGCVTRVDKNGTTWRGCQSQLDDNTFYACLKGTDNLCELCAGDKCNEIDVYPAERPRCQQCNSAEDATCLTAPNANKVCAVYNRNDVCVTNWHDGVTSRGCSSDFQCDTPGDQYTCRTCKGSGCNTANLETVTATNEPGLWQDVPLSCHQCLNATHCAEGKGVLRVCEGDKYQQCSTIFNEVGAVSSRSCSGAITTANRNYCADNPGNCMLCNSNGCNVATSLSSYVECVECDTRTNGGACANNLTAVTATRHCHKHCMTALFPLHDEWQPAYGTVRSCYDDKDLDERESCEAGTDPHCRICDGARCNVQSLPAERLSCYICEDDDCQRPVKQMCPNYRENDRCYIRYDETRAVVALGCRSEFSNAVADYLLSQKRLWFCEGADCNTFAALPTTQTCTLCSSRTDVRCATDPTAVSTTTSCSKPPYTDCYERVLADMATERGCLDSLYDEEFVDCLNGTSPLCHACTGARCNGGVYPVDRLACHVCDSSVDASCEKKPDHLSICPYYEEDDVCVTSYSNGATRRGCASSLQCDTASPRTCVQCVGAGCNTVNLAKKQDDNFGKWQDLPLTCRVCSGATDCTKAASTLPSEQCENNNEQDCMTVFGLDGKVMARGCADAVEAVHEDHCDENAGTCFTCKSNDCNTATSPAQFVECVYCDTAKDRHCVWAPTFVTGRRWCQDGCMTALYPAVDGIYETTRTCLNDKDAADRATCSAGTDAHCVACTTAGCNTAQVPADRRSCYICEGDDCESPKSGLCPLYRADDQCFIWFNERNDIAQMGCLSSFRAQSEEAVLGTKRVLLCDDGDNCNFFDKLAPAQKCVVCNSKEDKNCAANPQAVGTVATCNEQPHTGCYTQLRTDGSTWRDCLWNAPDANYVGCLTGTDTNCTSCKGNACNRDIFPADRQLCFTCTSADDPSCESSPERKLACPTVRNTEACVTALSGNITVRGCSSDVFCDTTDASTCRACYSSECNVIDLKNRFDDGMHGLWQPLPLKCHTCVGEHCLASLGPTEMCKLHEADCMTVFNVSSGEVQRRGCSDEVEDYEYAYCQENPDYCYRCKSNACNAAWSRDEYVRCVFCDSQKDSRCMLSPNSKDFEQRQCHQECMIAMLDEGKRLVRSCLDDKEEFVRYQCRTNGANDECMSCTSNDCNGDVYPADRMLCHHCANKDCTASEALYCENYTNDDYCFAKYENGHVAMMGCASSQNESDLQAWNATRSLYACQEAGCNDLSRLPDGNGQCVSCDSSKTLECAQNPMAVTYRVDCNAPFSDCVTRITSSGHTVRGCASTLSSVDQNACVANGTCSVCSESQCNNQVFPGDRRRCHICNSATDYECVKWPDHEQICPLYKPNDSCVIKDTDCLIERGCSSELSCDETDEEHCKICNTDGCNSADMTGGSMQATSRVMLSILLAVVVTKWGLGRE